MLSNCGEVRLGDEPAVEVHDTLHIPLLDFITASLISLGLWSVIGWTAWVMVG